jgi:tetratricopeptide (TPR) repeat protein
VRFDNLKIYRRAIPEVPSPTLIADRFWERGDFEVALDEYRGLLLDFPSGEIVKEILVKMADCMVRLGKYKDAYEVLRKSHSIREKEESFSARAYFLEGIIFSRLGYSEMADSVLNLLARRFPTHPVNASAMTSALLRTTISYSLGKPAIAYREIKASWISTPGILTDGVSSISAFCSTISIKVNWIQHWWLQRRSSLFTAGIRKYLSPQEMPWGGFI